MQQLGGNQHHKDPCASERLHAKLKDDLEAEKTATSSSSDTVVLSKKLQKDKSDIYDYYKVLLGDSRLKSKRKRKKRWLNDEVSIIFFVPLLHEN